MRLLKLGIYWWVHVLRLPCSCLVGFEWWPTGDCWDPCCGVLLLVREKCFFLLVFLLFNGLKPLRDFTFQVRSSSCTYAVTSNDLLFCNMIGYLIETAWCRGMCNKNVVGLLMLMMNGNLYYLSFTVPGTFPSGYLPTWGCLNTQIHIRISGVVISLCPSLPASSSPVSLCAT